MDNADDDADHQLMIAIMTKSFVMTDAIVTTGGPGLAGRRDGVREREGPGSQGQKRRPAGFQDAEAS